MPEGRRKWSRVVFPPIEGKVIDSTLPTSQVLVLPRSLSEFDTAAELQAARESLTTLIGDSRSIIRAVAEHGYRELNKLPWAESSIAPGHTMRFPVASGGVAIESTPRLSIIKGVTETYQKAYESTPTKTGVSVWVRYTDKSDLLPPTKLSIFSNGEAEYHGKQAFTSPRFSKPDSDGSDYMSREALLRDYAQAFIGALGVTDFIGMYLAAKGIEYDDKPVLALLYRWQQMEPNVT